MTHRKANQVTESTEESYQQAENLILDIQNIQNKIDGETTVRFIIFLLIKTVSLGIWSEQNWILA